MIHVYCRISRLIVRARVGYAKFKESIYSLHNTRSQKMRFKGELYLMRRAAGRNGWGGGRKREWD